MKEIDNNFVRNGFSYSLDKRVGSVAMFTKTQTNKPDSPKWFEVVKLVDDDGQEVFPASTSWGLLGFTFKGEQTEEANTKFTDLCSEFNEEAPEGHSGEVIEFTIPVTEEEETGENQSDSSLSAQHEEDEGDGGDSKYDDMDDEEKTDSKHDGFFQPAPAAAPAPSVNSNNVGTPQAASPKTRGRKRADVDFQVPKSGTFRAKDLASQYGVSVPFVHNRLNELIGESKVRVIEYVKGKRGKAQKVMEWIK